MQVLALNVHNLGVFFFNRLGAKVNISCDDTAYKVIDVNGKSTKLSKEEIEHDHLSPTLQELLSHSKNSLRHCKLLENAVEQLEEELEQGSYFPLIVGKRPAHLRKDATKKELDIPK